MLPHFHLLGLHIPMYSLMVAVGAFAFLIYFKIFVEKKEKLDRITANRMIFVSVLGFLVLGLSALIFNSIFHSIEKGTIVVGGITWLGGVIGVIPATICLIHYLVPKERGNAVNRFSSLLPGLVIAHAFGRLGCFFGGCCYGARTDSWLGVSFPAGSLAGKQYPDFNAPESSIIVNETLNEAGETVVTKLYPSLPVLPTQLIEAVFEILLFVVMIVFYKKLKNYNIEIYCFVYGTFRFILEFWRGDSRGATGIAISPSQFMSIILFIGATLLILYRNGIICKKTAKKCEIWREEAKTKEPTPIRAVFTANTAAKTADSIRELHNLYKEGLLTEEEFKKKKEELLARF